jgi:hypothetical protein
MDLSRRRELPNVHRFAGVVADHDGIATFALQA